MNQLAACEQWPRRPVDPTAYEAVASDAAVLVFAGERDTITPPDYAKRATRLMPHATIVDVPWLGHMPDGLIHAECLDAIEAAFLRDPQAHVDIACVATIGPPPFVVR